MGTWKDEYCPVCLEAVVLRIYSLVDPIDACSPPTQPAGVYEPLRVGAGPLELRVTVLQPASHDLEVRWWVLPSEIPRGTSLPSVSAPADRSSRGPLPAIEAKALRETRPSRDGVHVLELDAKDLSPGTYRVVCRVRDTCEIPRARWPLVLRDDRGLLESERVWWIQVPQP